MARRKYNKGYGKKRKWNGGSGTYSKRSYGQFKAAKNQSDQASFVMNIPTQISVMSVKKPDANGEDQVYGTFPLNIYDLLRKSEFYQSYANMYDEFKLDNIKVKLIPIKYNVSVGTGATDYNSFTVYTAWDRTGLNGNQLELISSGKFNDNPIDPNNPAGPTNIEYLGKDTDADGIYCLVGEDITTYSSAESRQVTTGTNCTITRWLKPKTITEKAQWLSTASLKPWYFSYDSNLCAFQMIPLTDNSEPLQIQRVFDLARNGDEIGPYLSTICPAISSNPCYLEEDSAISFKPTLLVGLYPPEEYTHNLTPRGVTFNVECEVSCSFRGLRKSKIV